MDKKLTIGMIITLALIMSGTYYLAQDDDAFYCESKDMVMICEKLSKINAEGTQTRCYFNETYKICREGWIYFENTKIIEMNDTEFICGEESFIKECVSNNGQIILRIKS